MERLSGISSKRWFFGFRNWLRRRKRARHVLAGSAAEQWLNGEFFAYLSEVLPSKYYVFPEVKKRDLSIFTLPPDDKLLASIEVKLVYRTYSEARIRVYAQRLIEQMNAATAEDRCASFGWFFGVYNSKWVGKARARQSLGEFRRSVGEIVRAEAADRGALVAKPSMETMLAEEPVMLGGLKRHVALVGQYLLLK
jgi:hypothetical protein